MNKPMGTASRLRVSVLDQSPISAGSTGAQALANSVDLARLADELGYRRYWVAEHHGTPMLACASPEALIGPIAASTTRISVGSGGVMLPHYSPLKVAETFSMFAGLFPGRIDLGIGRAPGTDGKTSIALQRDRRTRAPDDFPEQLTELLSYLDDTMPADHPFATLAALPGRPGRPEPWLLGSSLQSAIWAGQLGLPYCFADFINGQGAAIAEAYRTEWARSGHPGRPEVIVATAAIAADTDAEAQRVAASARMAFSLFHQGVYGPVPAVEDAVRYLDEHPREAAALAGRRRMTVGAPAAVRAGLEVVAAEYGAGEVMAVTITHDHQARRRSYELVAAAFGLGSALHTRADAGLAEALL